MARRLVAVCSIVLLMASVASAQTQKRGQRPGGGQGQGPGGFGFGQGGITTLLAMPEVQKEIGVTDEQKKLVADMLKDLTPAGGQGGGNRQNLGNLSDEERAKAREAATKKRADDAKKAEDMAKLILEPKQMERLGEIRLQRDGVLAFARPEIADKLGLSQDQKDKIRKIQEDARQAGGGFGRPGGGGGNATKEDRKAAAEKAIERLAKTRTDILAVLTASQKESWEKMQGKKFDFPQRGPRNDV